MNRVSCFLSVTISNVEAEPRRHKKINDRRKAAAGGGGGGTAAPIARS